MIFAIQMDDQCPLKFAGSPKTGFENAFDMYYIIYLMMSIGEKGRI